MIDFGCGVRLGAITDIDLETLRKWRNDPRIMRWTRQNDLLHYWDQNKWKSRLESDPTVRMYSIFDLSEQPIGVCGLTGINLVNGNAEFSLYIAPAFHRQGHGKKALKTLISHGFNTLRLQVIYGETFEHNPAAKMFVDVGFEKQGVRRSFYYREGRFIDAHLYDILREKWVTSESFNGCRERCFT